MPDNTDTKPVSLKSSALWGALAGAVIVGLDMVPAFSYRSFLFLSFASGTLGVWGRFSLLILRRSGSAREAGKNVLAFLAVMSVVYYCVEGARDSYESYQDFKDADPEMLKILAEGGESTWVCFHWRALLNWTGLSLVCGVGAYFIVRFEGTILGDILLAVPMAAMVGDAFSAGTTLITQSVGLAPAVINAAGYAYCAAGQPGKSRDRLITLILSCLLGAVEFLTVL